jgi:hypothetical protein
MVKRWTLVALMSTGVRRIVDMGLSQRAHHEPADLRHDMHVAKAICTASTFVALQGLGLFLGPINRLTAPTLIS